MKIFKLLTLISTIPLTSYSHKEMKFEALNPVQQTLHKQLFNKVKNTNKNTNKNYLTASILVYFSDKTTLEIPISPFNPTGLEIPIPPSNPTDVFVSKFYKHLQEFHLNARYVLDKEFESEKNEKLASFLNKKRKPDHRVGDTELALIYTLCQPETYKSFKNFISNDKYSDITSLELHCHSTRDMCPCCYQHMQNFLDECNKIDSKLDNLFKNFMKDVEKRVLVSFYVSSICRFPTNCDEFKYSNYSYCSKSPPDDVGINYIFLRKNPEDLISPENSYSEDLSSVIESAKAVEEKED